MLAACVDLGTQSYAELEPGDVPAAPTYEEDIRPIIEARCSQCHSRETGTAKGEISYDTYDNLLPATTSRRGEDEEDEEGWGGIRKKGIDDRSMPPGGMQRITAREEAILLRWAEIGFPEN